MDVVQYTESILGKGVNIYILNMQRSHFVWVGEEPKLNDLSVAMKSAPVSGKFILLSLLDLSFCFV